jgi:lysozyme
VNDWRGYCLPLIKASEGCKLVAYADPEPAGIRWTVGYGATGPDIVEGTTWTQEQADADLAQRLDYFNAGITRLIRVRITPKQRAALVDLAYNIGMHEFAQSEVLRYLNDNDYARACARFGLFILDDGEVKRGLLTRRYNEAMLFAEDL